MAKDLMRYDKLAQEALRGVVKDALTKAASPEGLPGAHHFYITFKTTDSRCDLDESLLKSYPDEMTIVLEHQFWDLAAEDDHFEVTLKFGGVPKYLRVPYVAVTRFHDPAVGFYLHFEYEPADTPPGDGVDHDDSIRSDEAETVVSLDAFRKKD